MRRIRPSTLVLGFATLAGAALTAAFVGGIVSVAFVAVADVVSSVASAAEPGYGPNPALPEPEHPLLPTVKVAPVIGWRPGATPKPASGLTVKAFATRLEHPRWLYVLPNGDVLVAETRAPAQPEDDKGFRGWAQKRVMKKAGALGDSPDRITLLRDTDGDGVAETRSVFLEGLHSPFGMALVGDRFYVANADAVVVVPYEKDAKSIKAKPRLFAALPGGQRNHHWTKSLIASEDGQRLYAGIGSNSNVAEFGMDEEVGRAAIWEIDAATGKTRVFASGLRNPVGMAWEPTSHQLWVSVNERDEIGNDLVPDYMTSVREGGFYGWPYSYYGQHVDDRVEPPRADLVAKAIVPDYALGAHTASLGLAAARGNKLGDAYAEGMFVGQHGSWNRKPPAGYRVIFVPFSGGKPSGDPRVVLDGFIDDDFNAQGRPVGVAVDARGGLLVADDVGNVVWRVTH